MVDDTRRVNKTFDETTAERFDRNALFVFRAKIGAY